MLTQIGLQHVQDAFAQAVRHLELEMPLPQKAVKPALIVAVDKLVGIAYGKQNPLPWLCASGISRFGAEDKVQNTRPYAREYMLDVTVYRGDSDPYTPLATAESEAYAEHEARDSSSSDTSDYLWDFYKLLQVPSPLRVFIARVRGIERCKVLERRLEQFCTKYYCQCLSEGDRVFTLVLPMDQQNYAQAPWHVWIREMSGSIENVAKSVGPNQALQQTGHANDGFARRYVSLRVSRLLSFVFGYRREFRGWASLSTTRPADRDH